MRTNRIAISRAGATVLATVLVGLAPACGSNSPTGSTKVTCGDVQGQPVVIRLAVHDWAGATATFDAGRTVYADTADISGVETPTVGPGDRVLIEVDFASRLRFVSHDSWTVNLEVSGKASGYQGESTIQSVHDTGSWSGLHAYYARCYATVPNHVLTGTFAVAQASPKQNETLDCIVFDYTLPARFNDGTPLQSGPLPVTQVAWTAYLDGDHTGEPPPIVSP